MGWGREGELPCHPLVMYLNLLDGFHQASKEASQVGTIRPTLGG